MPRPKKYQAHLITHTHWDREWYQSLEIYRFRLIEVFERLKAILPNPDYHSFYLDGQTIPVDDYLEARPDDRAALMDYIRQGKLQIGPFYVLLDEQLANGESHVRNLMLGQCSAREYGATAMIGPCDSALSSTAPPVWTS